MNKMLIWRDRIYWSVVNDCKMSRISVFDINSKEFWKEIPFDRDYRKKRNDAIREIIEYIEQVDEKDRPINSPGRVQ